MAAQTSTQPTRCKRCRRPLTNLKSVSAEYGPGCARIIRGELGDYSPAQTVKAVALIETGAVRRLRSRHYRLYEVQGTYTAYQTDGIDCTCSGAREHGSCYHSQAVRLFERQIAAAAASGYALAA